MKVSRRKTFIIFLLLVSIGLIVIINFKKTKVYDHKIKATVIEVVQKPNESEDGYYKITVKNTNNQIYIIDATGYLNTPASPDQFGESCVQIPQVKVGDKVSFNLPKSKTQQISFDICYKKNLTGYYFERL